MNNHIKLLLVSFLLVLVFAACARSIEPEYNNEVSFSYPPAVEKHMGIVTAVDVMGEPYRTELLVLMEEFLLDVLVRKGIIEIREGN